MKEYNTFPPVKQMKISVSEQCVSNAIVPTLLLPSVLLISTEKLDFIKFLHMI